MNPLTRRQFLQVAGAGVGAIALPRLLLGQASTPAQPPPNVIFFLTDDLGWGDPHCFGHPFLKTPNIDRLAAGGTMFKQFYVANPVCSPSRTAFMTGHFPARHRIHQHLADPAHNQRCGMPNWLDPDAVTVADVVRKAGYTTAHFGKWHLGHGPNAPTPSAYGLDDHRTCNSAGPGWDEAKDPFFRAHSTGLFVDETLRVIRAAVAAGKPFYVNLWTLVPHALLKPTPAELKAYADLKVDPDVFTGYMRDYARKAKDLPAQMKVYASAVTGLDAALARLLDELDKLKLADNTLILFSSDNGPEDYHVGNAANAGMGSPGPHRGRKRSLYEGGVRTACIARLPGRIPAGKTDETSVLASVDWLPTVASLTGATLPDLKPDGEDVLDILTGKARPRRTPLLWEWRGGVAGNPVYHPPRLALREAQWKLLVNPNARGAQLYDIPADPTESHDLAAAHPDLVAQMTQRVLAWKKTLPN